MAFFNDRTNTWLFVPTVSAHAGVCPTGTAGGVAAFQITATATSVMYTGAWCRGVGTSNAPAVSANGTSNAILWVAQQGGTLTAYRVSSGAQLYRLLP